MDNGRVMITGALDELEQLLAPPQKEEGGGRSARAPGAKRTRAAATPEQQKMVGALAKVCHMDIGPNAGQLGSAAARLIRSGYTADQVLAWYQPDGWYWHHCYWGRDKKVLPNIAIINRTIAMARDNIDPDHAKLGAPPTPVDEHMAKVERLRKRWGEMDAEQHQRFLQVFVDEGIVDANGKLLPPP